MLSDAPKISNRNQNNRLRGWLLVEIHGETNFRWETMWALIRKFIRNLRVGINVCVFSISVSAGKHKAEDGRPAMM